MFRRLAIQNKKNALIYLANDVVQMSTKNGPEYRRQFGNVLERAFAHIGETCKWDEKMFHNVARVLNVWEDRGVYDAKIIQKIRNELNRNGNGGLGPKGSAASLASSKRKTVGSTARALVENGKVAKKSKASYSGIIDKAPAVEDIMEALRNLKQMAFNNTIIIHRVAELSPVISQESDFRNHEVSVQLVKTVSFGC